MLLSDSGDRFIEHHMERFKGAVVPEDVCVEEDAVTLTYCSDITALVMVRSPHSYYVIPEVGLPDQ
ncbi:TPA: hypothetical protein HA265_03770 [Candidatus Woesearchaeota archaeon]|nr:hypothetical protein [Candidatus Woesearchaeota archaeon]